MFTLAKYAIDEKSNATQRQYKESSHAFRSPFQRDRDRIVHSKAFRRLEYKTQVFVNHLGDNFRTRLTHSIEVAQISRSVARTLQVNEDLTETIALAHDLGHSPFGHAGEKVLNRLMAPYGGFNHNEQTLRIVTLLEERYPQFSGLNLTQATKLGLQKHKKLIMERSHSLEAQIVNICDAIAYNNHDLDDGLNSQLLTLDELEEVQLWSDCWKDAHDKFPKTSLKIKICYSIRSLINKMVTNLIEQTEQNILIYKIKTFEDVINFHKQYNKHSGIVGFSEEFFQSFTILKKFLNDKLYKHPEIEKMNLEAKETINRIFYSLCKNQKFLPKEYQDRIPNTGLHKTICDFIAGMTDRYAINWNSK